ncbi:DUF6114 domain-containing protein [Streptomyces sp. NPDC050560]|uniref:DUF6114 domain-containing protein n=1 Tax=Streptomyces sp. NPDC050560 TaxID=3365630 RepID=UPI0037B51AE8
MTAEAQAGPSGRLGRMRRTFRAWRWQRPFWGGLLTLLGGIPIMYFPYANLTLGSMTIRMATTAGAGSLIIGVLLVVLGLTMWFQRHSRVFAGVAGILLGLVSLVVSNFGGFLVGFLLALVGGALAVSWAPGTAPAGAEDGEGAADGSAAGRGIPHQSRQEGDPAYGDNGANSMSGEDGVDGENGADGVSHDLLGSTPSKGTNGGHRRAN